MPLDKKDVDRIKDEAWRVAMAALPNSIASVQAHNVLKLAAEVELLNKKLRALRGEQRGVVTR